MVARRFPPDVRSGTERVFENLYNQARQRHEVRLVVGYTRARDQVPPEAVAVDLRGLSKAQSWAAIAKACIQEELRFKPDAVLGNSIEVVTLRTPLACIVHDLNFGSLDRGLSSQAKVQFYRLRSRFSKCLITVSDAARKSLKEAGLKPRSFHVIHNGVDLAQFSPYQQEREDKEVHLAYPSRILPGKGQHLAIDAVARLPRLHKRRASLTIVGAVVDTIFYDQLKVQAHEQPVEFATDVVEIASYYQKADIILFPTLLEEGFGFTAVEAMACGKPVIYFEQSAVREATGGLGIGVPRGDVDAMRDAIRDLMDDPDRREALGKAGRAYVEEHYAWSVVWRNYERILEGLIA